MRAIGMIDRRENLLLRQKLGEVQWLCAAQLTDQPFERDFGADRLLRERINRGRVLDAVGLAAARDAHHARAVRSAQLHQPYAHSRTSRMMGMAHPILTQTKCQLKIAALLCGRLERTEMQHRLLCVSFSRGG